MVETDGSHDGRHFRRTCSKHRAFLTATNLCKRFLGQEYTGLLVIIKTVLFTNILPEYLISLLAVPQIVLGVRRGLRLGIEADRQKERAAETQKNEIQTTA